MIKRYCKRTLIESENGEIVYYNDIKKELKKEIKINDIFVQGLMDQGVCSGEILRDADCDEFVRDKCDIPCEECIKEFIRDHLIEIIF